MKKIFILFIFIFTFTLCSCDKNVLTVDYDGGTYNNQTSETIVLDSVKTVNDLGKPEKHGYEFIGWADSNKSTKALDKNTELNKDMKLTPIYEPKEFVIEFKTENVAMLDTIPELEIKVKKTIFKGSTKGYVQLSFCYDNDSTIELRAEGIKGYNTIVIKSDLLKDDIILDYTYSSVGKSTYGVTLSPSILSEVSKFACYYENRVE
ncbi:MAG: InlB B-repeat-containing protein [Acholeplasmatales bacterium]|nr:InlB B-repeat-containing protein [Acholeplasmatales bacterium]